jgi:GMP synthase-like glutamine amidotransferase
VDVLVLQHIACEPPGAFEDVLAAAGADIHRVELDEGDPLPSWQDYVAIVAMGGPMSANDDAELPWLTAEKQAVAEAVRAGVPYWGSCLGVQLLAAALGGRVYPGTQPEVGVLPVALTEEGKADPVFAGLPAEFPTLQWHGDAFELPEGGVLLASSPAYPNQAFRVGPTAYGVQFHLEVTERMAREWAEVPAYAEYADRVLGDGGIDRLMADFDAARDGMLDVGRRMFERWVEIAVAVPR